MHHFSIGFYDEKHLIRSFIYKLFSRVPEIEICFNAYDECSLFDAMSKSIPCVLFMSMVTKNRVNHQLVKKINTDFPNLKIVGFVYGVELSEQEVFQLINSGVVSILTDADSPEEIFITIKMVAKKGFHINEVVNEAMVYYCKRRNILPQTYGPPEKFTEREIRIIEEKKAGKTSKEIAEQLFVSKKTVDGTLQSLYDRLGCRNFNELARKYDFQFGF